MGAGADTIVLTAEAASATLGGGGADSITLDVAAAIAIKIAGDAAGVVGKDTITLITSVLVEKSTSRVQVTSSPSVAALDPSVAPARSLVTLAATSSPSVVALRWCCGLTVGGGQGSDTIALDEFGSAGSGAFVIGGGGADSIILDANDVNSAGDGFSPVAAWNTHRWCRC